MGCNSRAAKRFQFPISIAILQILFIILSWKFVGYGSTADARTAKSTVAGVLDNRIRYAMFGDVHVMIFIGFGFLMTFLHKYGFSAVSYNMLLSAVAIQWSTIIRALIHNASTGQTIDLKNLILSDFDCAIVLISFGALLGKTTPMQLLIMVLLEIPMAQANAYLAENVFHAADIGGSMILHTFGAYFGLGAAVAMYRSAASDNSDNGSSVESDLFSMIGTVFLWIYWPSFNGALGDNDLAERAIINTYLALTAATVVTFCLSVIAEPKGKFKMVMVQNSTIAGGVGVGAVANFMIHPFGALLVGSAAGVISVVGFSWIQSALEKLRIHDTCGVHNLHGMPGVMSGIASVIGAAIASTATYSNGLYALFPKRNAVNATSMTLPSGSVIVAGSGWSAATQAGMQLATLGCTLAIAIVGGIITGAIMRIPCVDRVPAEQLYKDEDYWEIPEKELPINNDISKSSYTVNTAM